MLARLKTLGVMRGMGHPADKVGGDAVDPRIPEEVQPVAIVRKATFAEQPYGLPGQDRQ
jgi:hypothetical protein